MSISHYLNSQIVMGNIGNTINVPSPKMSPVKFVHSHKFVKSVMERSPSTFLGMDLPRSLLPPHLPLCPSRLWFMERLLGAASPLVLLSLVCCTSSLRTFRRPASPPQAIHPLEECQARLDIRVSLGMAICEGRVSSGVKLSSMYG